MTGRTKDLPFNNGHAGLLVHERWGPGVTGSDRSETYVRAIRDCLT